MKKVIINTELCEKIKKLQYKVESRKEVISYMLNNKNIDSEQFEKYQEEYENYFQLYNEAKQELVDTYIGKNTSVNWNLEFKTCELTIN